MKRVLSHGHLIFFLMNMISYTSIFIILFGAGLIYGLTNQDPFSSPVDFFRERLYISTETPPGFLFEAGILLLILICTLIIGLQTETLQTNYYKKKKDSEFKS